MRAYEEMIRNTSTKHAPWYVVPADHKWFTRLAVAEAIIQSIEELNLAFPRWTRKSAKTEKGAGSSQTRKMNRGKRCAPRGPLPSRKAAARAIIPLRCPVKVPWVPRLCPAREEALQVVSLCRLFFRRCFFRQRYSTLHQRRVRASVPDTIRFAARSEDCLRQRSTCSGDR